MSFVKINLQNRGNHVIGEIYQPPNGNYKTFEECYHNLLKIMSKEKNDLIIGTDQNLDFIKIDQHVETSNFLDLNLTYHILPTITKPTRVTTVTATLIDKIFFKWC